MCAVQSSRRKAGALVAQGQGPGRSGDSGGRSRFRACEVGDVGVLEATQLEVSPSFSAVKAVLSSIKTTT